MELLKQKILAEGRVVGDGILKVDGFLNHQIDVELVSAMGKEIYERFKDDGVTKILTIEASGIGLAVMAAQYFGCKVLFAKKSRTTNMGNADLYVSKAYSFTHQNENTVLVSKKYIQPGEKLLIVDDFLAHGEASRALLDIARQAGAEVAGVAIVIEKGFQGGGDEMRREGINLYSLAIVDSMDEGKIIFREN
ncbi:MAG: xanthine phosphoribosyltransferase [Clostridia bacterium]|nr:xanthine phosphoribosyltransferase [Clostridia bacterium]